MRSQPKSRGKSHNRWCSVWTLAVRVKKRRAIEREIWSAPPIASAPFGWRF